MLVISPLICYEAWGSMVFLSPSGKCPQFPLSHHASHAQTQQQNCSQLPAHCWGQCCLIASKATKSWSAFWCASGWWVCLQQFSLVCGNMCWVNPSVGNHWVGPQTYSSGNKVEIMIWNGQIGSLVMWISHLLTPCSVTTTWHGRLPTWHLPDDIYCQSWYLWDFYRSYVCKRKESKGEGDKSSQDQGNLVYGLGDTLKLPQITCRDACQTWENWIQD